MKYLYCILFLSFLLPLHGQDTIAFKQGKNAVYVDVFGNGGYFSMNYERRLFQKNKLAMWARVGISIVPPPVSFNVFMSYPVEAMFSYGNKTRLEIGLAATPCTRVYKDYLFKLYDAYVYTGFRVGVVVPIEDRGFFVRLGLLGVYKPQYIGGKSRTTWWPSLGFGYRFGR